VSAGAFFDSERLNRRSGGNAYAELLDATRAFLDAACAADAPAEVSADVATALGTLTARLAPHAADALSAPAGNRSDLPGEGHPMLPPVVLTDWSPDTVRGQVTFRRAHDASGHAVHGGMLPLVYDDVLGRLAARQAPMLRTAYLTVEYKAVTPIGQPVAVEARIEEIEGRKVFLSGRMHLDGTTLTTARALFVVLRDAQR
jgi:acyl-CoA thioesterase FadM